MLRNCRVNPDRPHYLDRFLLSISKLALAVIFAVVVFATQSDAASRSIVIHHNYSNIKHKRAKIRHHRVISSNKLSPSKQRVSSGNRLRKHHRASRKHHYNSGSSRRFNNYGTGHFEPKIINVPQVLRTRGSTRTNYRGNVTGSNDHLERHEIPNGGVYVNSRPRAAYYNDKKCNSGKTCVVRLGPNRSSPKMIVIGDNE